MSGRGVLYAIDDDVLAQLGEAPDDAAVLAIVGELEERWEAGFTCELEKSWEAIHRTLSGGSLDTSSGTRLERLAVLGGTCLVRDDETIVSVKAPDQVQKLARLLAGWDRPRFRQAYYAIDRSEYGDLDEEDLDYAWVFFERAVELYREAASVERAVVFSLS